MVFKAKSGAEITDEMFEQMAEEWESGKWEGSLYDVKVGRPREFDEELRSVTFRLPASRLAALEAAAARTGRSRSDLLRDAVDRELLSV